MCQRLPLSALQPASSLWAAIKRVELGLTRHLTLCTSAEVLPSRGFQVFLHMQVHQPHHYFSP